ncbi:MAG: L-glutamate gamma-semialdehyde dehydrogenase [Planctomycetaceae bacterium]
MPDKETDFEQQIEADIQMLGRKFWDRIERRAPNILDRRWWDDRILSWAMADESVKVQMFRFVDVLPMLKTHEQITRHLNEYFDEVREHLPWAARLGLDLAQPNSVLGRALALNAKSNSLRMAKRFIAGLKVDEVLQSVRKIRKQGFAFTLDLLGEAVISEQEAEAYQNAYIQLLEGLSPLVNEWPGDEVLDHDHERSIPRMNVSLKLSALYSQFSPLDPEGTAEYVLPRLRTLLRTARDHGAYVHVDMEQYDYKDLTLELFRRVLSEEEFRDVADVGVVLQAYLPDAEKDLNELLAWVKKRGTPIWIRLVKGAYWDYETISAQARGWPIPVYQQKWQSDENFERMTRTLFENYRWLQPAIASHNLRSIVHALAVAKQWKVPKKAFELQMLYGMGNEQAQLFAEEGYRVRVYTPFGELIPGMAYLVRRLLENTSNDSFLRQSFTEHLSFEELFMSPSRRGVTAPAVKTEPIAEFINEPHTDFSIKANRDAMLSALETVRDQFDKEYSLVIDGRRLDTRGKLIARNPSQKATVVGTIASAAPEDAKEAVAAAQRAYRRWSKTDVQYRAEYLNLVAEEMRIRRFDLAAWEVYECGKPWAEADADVAEAIDFCRYYADQMLKLAIPQQVDLPGEENSYSYRPRGVCVVIAPWNFPLAILTGMTAAALITGNTVVMKPAEQSSIIAAQLMHIFEDIGLPSGVVNYLPGVGEDIGPALVQNPDVALIAFTGSRTVGLTINRESTDVAPGQRMVKHVIAEMGGKNAIIIDEDADLDEAVKGVVQSAFGYAGQKCSACSRVIVLNSVYDTFVNRLVSATESLNIGPADRPGTFVGPVIDEAAFNRIREYIEIGKHENTLVSAVVVEKLEQEGYFVGPHIFAGVTPSSRLAQEEIFGPVLVVMKASDLGEAVAIANDSDYALTGGIFSRSPANLKRARVEFEVGNLYLNRSITGALVHRQPFGGYKLSGIGTKAGGPDYLHQFLIPVNVTENTLRRGFAPPPDDEG